MKYSTAAVLAFAAGAIAGGEGYGAPSNVTYTTVWMTALTTVCPSPTEVVQGSKTWTVTEVRTQRSIHTLREFAPNRDYES